MPYAAAWWGARAHRSPRANWRRPSSSALPTSNHCGSGGLTSRAANNGNHHRPPSPLALNDYRTVWYCYCYCYCYCTCAPATPAFLIPHTSEPTPLDFVGRLCTSQGSPQVRYLPWASRVSSPRPAQLVALSHQSFGLTHRAKSVNSFPSAPR